MTPERPGAQEWGPPHAAGIPRRRVYLTNAVKHFRFERRGKRRIHDKRAVGHIVACRPWLEAEFEAVSPTIVVALGATAARTVSTPSQRPPIPMA